MPKRNRHKELKRTGQLVVEKAPTTSTVLRRCVIPGRASARNCPAAKVLAQVEFRASSGWLYWKPPETNVRGEQRRALPMYGRAWKPEGGDRL